MTQIVLSKDGTKIAFDQVGKGDTVNLVGGAFQHSPSDQRAKQLAPLLSKHFAVIHCDRRGRGEHGATQPYSLDREIEVRRLSNASFGSCGIILSSVD